MCLTYKLEEVNVNKELNEIVAYFNASRELIASDNSIYCSTLMLTYPTTNIEHLDSDNVLVEIAPTVDNGVMLVDKEYKKFNLDEATKVYLTNIVKLRGNVDYNKLCLNMLELFELELHKKDSLSYRFYDNQRKEYLDNYEFTNATSMIDCLDSFINDYIVEAIEKDQDVDLYGTLEDELNRLLNQNILTINWDVQVLDMVCNHFEKIDIKKVYCLQIGDENGYNSDFVNLLDFCELELFEFEDEIGGYGLIDLRDVHTEELEGARFYTAEAICFQITSLLWSLIEDIEEKYYCNLENWNKGLQSIKNKVIDWNLDTNLRMLDVYLNHSYEIELAVVHNIIKDMEEVNG